jgi:hypothetical protein
VLAVLTSGSYHIEEKVLVADWTPGLKERPFLYFKIFPDPNVPKHVLNQEIVDSVAKLVTHEIPRPVRLAIRWWARGVAMSPASDQFQYFWYALEILAEHVKPSVKVASKCPHCQGELFCPACNRAPVHRPYPKQAIKMLIEKHVRGDDRQRLYTLIDNARNRLLHGDDPRDIERDLGIEWGKLSDSLGKATWAAILTTLVNIDAAHATERRRLAMIDVNTYLHWEVTVVSDMSMGATHVDPSNPQIEEFWPNFKLDMIVKDRDEVEGRRTTDRGDSPAKLGQ